MKLKTGNILISKEEFNKNLSFYTNLGFRVKSSMENGYILDKDFPPPIRSRKFIRTVNDIQNQIANFGKTINSILIPVTDSFSIESEVLDKYYLLLSLVENKDNTYCLTLTGSNNLFLKSKLFNSIELAERSYNEVIELSPQLLRELKKDYRFE